MSDLFSSRIGASKPAEGLVYEAVPDGAINGLVNYLMLLGTYVLGDLEKEVRMRLDILKDESTWDPKFPSFFRAFFRDRASGSFWYRFYDICEIVWHALSSEGGRNSFENAVNEIFARNHVGYQMRNGKIERVGSRVADEVIAVARGVLTDERLAGPNEQFLKALAFLNLRPKPDLENAVKEAIGAVEGIARIITGKPSILLSDALKQWQTSGLIPATIKKAIDGLYAYRGDAEGVAHGKVGVKQVAEAEAEFILHCSAAIIVYLASLHGYRVT